MSNEIQAWHLLTSVGGILVLILGVYWRIHQIWIAPNKERNQKIDADLVSFEAKFSRIDEKLAHDKSEINILKDKTSSNFRELKSDIKELKEESSKDHHDLLDKFSEMKSDISAMDAHIEENSKTLNRLLDRINK